MIARRSFIKLWGTTLVSASFFGVTGCSAGDAESSTIGSVYMVSKIVGYSGSGLNARTITTEYAYDEKGNLAKITQTVEHPNAANLGTSTDIYILDYDEDGLPKGVSQSQSNKQNDVYVGSLDMAAEVDGEGRYTKLDKAGSGMTYEYDNDGRIKAATAYYASSSDTNGKTFDEKGWMATRSTNGEEAPMLSNAIQRATSPASATKTFPAKTRCKATPSTSTATSRQRRSTVPKPLKSSMSKLRTPHPQQGFLLQSSSTEWGTLSLMWSAEPYGDALKPAISPKACRLGTEAALLSLPHGFELISHNSKICRRVQELHGYPERLLFRAVYRGCSLERS